MEDSHCSVAQSVRQQVVNFLVGWIPLICTLPLMIKVIALLWKCVVCQELCNRLHLLSHFFPHIPMKLTPRLCPFLWRDHEGLEKLGRCLLIATRETEPLTKSPRAQSSSSWLPDSRLLICHLFIITVLFMPILYGNSLRTLLLICV